MTHDHWEHFLMLTVCVQKRSLMYRKLVPWYLSINRSQFKLFAPRILLKICWCAIQWEAWNNSTSASYLVWNQSAQCRAQEAVLASVIFSLTRRIYQRNGGQHKPFHHTTDLFSVNPDPDSDPGFLWKKKKNFTLEERFQFLWAKQHNIYSLAFKKDFQAISIH